MSDNDSTSFVDVLPTMDANSTSPWVAFVGNVCILTIVIYCGLGCFFNCLAALEKCFCGNTSKAEGTQQQRRQGFGTYRTLRVIIFLAFYCVLIVIVSDHALTANDLKHYEHLQNIQVKVKDVVQEYKSFDSSQVTNYLKGSSSVKEEEETKKEPESTKKKEEETKEETKKEPESTKEVSTKEETKKEPFLEALSGGVLPIRRFIIVGGSELDKKEKVETVTKCNDFCQSKDSCDAWEFQSSSHLCRLFQDNPQNEEEVLSTVQADNNNENFIVGFTQRKASVLQLQQTTSTTTPAAETTTTTTTEIKNKILYILNFPDHDIPANIDQIVKDVLPKSWQASLMDLVISTPREYSISLDKDITAFALRNPFRYKDNTKDRGSNLYMSLPMAHAKFPGYKGYLQVHYQAVLKLWKLPPAVFFNNSPWVTFRTSYMKEQAQISPRIVKRPYPYGSYEYSWYNFDSGTASGRKDKIVTRSNFDATLDAMKGLCSESEKSRIGLPLSSNSLLETNFCPKISQNILSPYFPHTSPTKAFYVPNTKNEGEAMIKAMILFGEHDIFHEIAIPTLMASLLPVTSIIEMPFCDGTKRTWGREWSETDLKFKRTHVLQQTLSKKETGWEDDDFCPILHPMQFETEAANKYWKEEIEKNCGDSCHWDFDHKLIHWKISTSAETTTS